MLPTLPPPAPARDSLGDHEGGYTTPQINSSALRYNAKHAWSGMASVRYLLPVTSVAKFTPASRQDTESLKAFAAWPSPTPSPARMLLPDSPLGQVPSRPLGVALLPPPPRFGSPGQSPPLRVTCRGLNVRLHSSGICTPSCNVIRAGTMCDLGSYWSLAPQYHPEKHLLHESAQ